MPVAITRARSLLVVIGDPALLSLDPVWNEFLHYVRGGGGWRGVEYELPELDEDADDNAGGDAGALASNLGGLQMSQGQHDFELPMPENP